MNQLTGGKSPEKDAQAFITVQIPVAHIHTGCVMLYFRDGEITGSEPVSHDEILIKVADLEREIGRRLNPVRTALCEGLRRGGK